MMTAIQNLLSTSWAEALGWTLVHSLWQGLVILLLLALAIRVVPPAWSRLRYAMACAALMLLVTASVVTFTSLAGQAEPDSAYQPSGLSLSSLASFEMEKAMQEDVSAGMISSLWKSIRDFIESHISVLLVVWIIGALLFSMRLFGGWLYLFKLKNSARSIDNEWHQRVQQLARQLNIRRVITLAESMHIHAPVVIGYLKPMILVPVGMFTGMEPTDLESILVHELAHIRRHDYLVNILQSVVESLYFFNPFVWMISSRIRREREYCCDDAVLRMSVNALHYARALACLEEARLSKTTLAMSLAESKGQLLNRIKRMMEKTARNNTGRERIIPIALLIIGLVCASWITVVIDKKPMEDLPASDPAIAVKDTVIKKNEKSASYYRKKVTTIGEDGQPHEEIVEKFEGDEELRPMLEINDAFIPPVPPVPGMSFMPAPLAFDSIPRNPFYFQNRIQEEIDRILGEVFDHPFENFYHDDELDTMIKEMRERFRLRFDTEKDGAWHDFEWDDSDMEKFQEKMEAWQREWEEQQFDMNRFHEMALRAQEEVFKRMEERHRDRFQSQKFAEELTRDMQAKVEKMQSYYDQRMKKVEEKMKRFDEKMKQFESELREELIRDGYFEPDEKIESMSWDEDGDIKVNGKTIKDQHKAKYKDLQKKYFQSHGSFQ